MEAVLSDNSSIMSDSSNSQNSIDMNNYDLTDNFIDDVEQIDTDPYLYYDESIFDEN